MAVTYDEIAYDEIELGLRSIISKEFSNVYIANDFTMKGNECVRINLDSSSLLLQTGSLEQREYSVTVRYYHNADTNIEIVNKSVKGKIDRLRKHLLDNQVNTSKNWSALIIDEINYDVEDEENEEVSSIHIAEFNITIRHHNAF